MLQKQSVWKNYFDSRCKAIALGSANLPPLTYGREVYTSAEIIRGGGDNGVREFLRWIVTEFDGEYNVFLESSINGKPSKTFVNFYKWKESAIKFALEMLLVSNGILRRAGIGANF